MAANNPSWRTKVKNALSLKTNYDIKPLGFKWRSNTLFIVATVGLGMFSDLFLYCLVVPILPFILADQVGLPPDQIQRYTSTLLAVYAGASVIACPIAGFVTDKIGSRQTPFLGGLFVLIFATVLLFTGTTIPVLAIARVLQGLSSAVVWTVGLALAMDTVGAKNMGKTIGTLFSFTSVGELFAPALGGIIYHNSGHYAVLAFSLAILLIDLIMRILVIEHRVAARYVSTDDEQDQPDSQSADPTPENTDGEANEQTALLPNGENTSLEEEKEYHIPDGQPAIIKAAPILYPVLYSPSLMLAYILTFSQAFMLGAYDATVPTQASEVYGFDALKAGLLFVPLSIVTLIFGPLGGWAVDRYGTKWPAVFGNLWIVPFLVMLRLPKPEPYPQQVYLWAGLLGALGLGLAIGGSPSLVEAGLVVDKFDKHNPGFFGENGPYTAMCGFTSMMFNLGLALGPVVAGELKDSIGYGNMNAIIAGVSFITAIASYLWLGGTVSWLKRKKSPE